MQRVRSGERVYFQGLVAFLYFVEQWAGWESRTITLGESEPEGGEGL